MESEREANKLKTAPTHTIGVPREDQATQLSHVCRGPMSVPCMLHGWWFRFCELLWNHISWFCGISSDVLDPISSYFLSSLSSAAMQPGNSLLLGILDWSHPCRFLEVCLLQVSTETWNASPFPVIPSKTLPLHPQPVTLYSHPTCPQSTLEISSFSLSREAHEFFLPSLSGSVNCCLVFLYN